MGRRGSRSRALDHRDERDDDRYQPDPAARREDVPAIHAVVDADSTDESAA
jgi:hypothetical protein